VWAAARFGLAGAALAAVWIQLGLIVALRTVVHSDLTVFELQVLMAALTMTGLTLGIVVDERARAALELRGSLRLAAAGQMAAAIAHELGQPLTALSSYARALQVLLERNEGLAPAEAQRAADIARRIVADTHRAADVVTRLRDFFRSGTTQFESVSPAAVIRDAIDGQRRRAAELGVQIEDAVEEGALPHVALDAVQIGVVLRNLIGNAVDAAAGGEEAGRVVVAARADAAELLVEVFDNGPGLPASQLPSLFDGGPSDKPGGMGVGLSLCRAIVDAHGGRLWAAAGPGGHFCFRLPLAEASHGANADAP
jgi:signal transduction histidine kinase